MSAVAVVGAGPAGLAVAAMLRREGVAAVVLEAGDEPGAAWAWRYDRLRLHTHRRLSALPGRAIPRAYGPWVARDDVRAYLRDYARAHGLDVRTRMPVARTFHVSPPSRVCQTPPVDTATDIVRLSRGSMQIECMPAAS